MNALRTTRCRSVWIAVLALLLAVPFVRAVKVDWPGRAEAESTNVFTGKITAVYSKVVQADPYEVTFCVAQVEIESVSKGDGLNPGQTVYVRYESRRHWVRPGTPSPGPGPHLNVPSEGQRRKICVKRNPDGTLDVYYVSGFQNP